MPKPRKTKAEKAADTLASRVCSAATSGAQIRLLDIPKLHRVAYDVLLAGGTEQEARTAADVWVAVNRTDTNWAAVNREALAASNPQAAQVAAYFTPPTYPLRFRTHSIMRDGTEWTSPEAFDAPHAHYIAQQCIAGHLMGSVYWCTEEGTGRFLDGIGRDGHRITASPISSAPAYGADKRAIYFPAVRVCNPHPRLTYRALRGSAATLVAYDTRDASLGPEPVGWVLGEDVPAGSVVS